MIFAPGAKKSTVTINDPTYTIFPARITWVICHNFSLSPYVISYYLRYFYIHTILQVIVWNRSVYRRA